VAGALPASSSLASANVKVIRLDNVLLREVRAGLGWFVDFRVLLPLVAFAGKHW
jgi:hypothetical protein